MDTKKIAIYLTHLTTSALLVYFTLIHSVNHFDHFENIKKQSVMSPSEQRRQSSIKADRFRFTYNVTNALFGIPWNNFLTIKRNNTIEYKYLADYKNPCWLENGSMRCLPYLYIIGVGRAGSTMLYKLLIKHQDIAKPMRKELDMWQKVERRSAATFNSYLKEFTEASCIIQKHTVTVGSKLVHNDITLEGTPSYFCDQGNLTVLPDNAQGGAPILTLAHTLYALNPKTKLIVILRNPTDRLFSFYRLLMDKRPNPVTFKNNVYMAVAQMKRCLVTSTVRQCVYNAAFNRRLTSQYKLKLTCSMYHPFAEDWLSVFPKKQILFLQSEEFYNKPIEITESIFRFLEIDPPNKDAWCAIQDEIKFKKWKLQENNVTAYRKSIPSETRKFLDEFFAPFNIRLSKLLGDDKFSFSKISA